MTKTQAIGHYGSQAALAKVLHLSQPTIAGWGKYPPEIQQVKLERVTKGALKAEPSCYLPQRRRAA